MMQHKTALIVAPPKGVKTSWPSVKDQIEIAKRWEAVTICRPDLVTPAEFMGTLSDGDFIGVWACEMLAPPIAKRKGETRRKVFSRTTRKLIEMGVTLEEWSTGRVSLDGADLGLMLLDAVDRISGVSGTNGRGRKPKLPFTDDEKLLIAQAWYGEFLGRNPDRVAAVQRVVPRFMEHDFYKPGMKEELKAIARGKVVQK